MKNYFYNVPKTMETLIEGINAHIEILISGTQKMIDAQNKWAQEEKQKSLNERTWHYELKKTDSAISKLYSLDDDSIIAEWYILTKNSNCEISADDNYQWSRPFNIKNGVLYFSDYYHQGRCWNIKNIKAGPTEETIESLVNYKW